MKITIKSKFLFGFFIIFAMAFLILNYSVNNRIDTNNEKIISEELKTIKKNCNTLIRQIFMINNYNNNETYYEKISKEIVEELANSIKSDIGVYTLNGKLIYSSNKNKFVNSEFKDINNAVSNKTSFTINYNKNNAEVFFSYPVIIAGNKIGILRIIKDYSSLYNESYNLLNFILYITLIIFAIAFLFSYMLSKNITIPITKLTKATTEAAQGNLNIDIHTNRKDELGELYSNFSIMIKKIDYQIKTIENDRDHLQTLIDHKKHFYDNVTHELKTPLTSILGYAQMIQDNGFSDEEFFYKGTHHVITESKRLHDMVLNLLEFSKQTSDLEEFYEKINIESLLRITCEGMFFKAERYKNTLQCVSEKNLYVYGSSDKLKQVFINIIDNAIKYGLSNSIISIKAYASKDFVNVDITNKGCGISKDNITKIFTPFYKVNKQQSKELGSCGLGLSISKAIIENHKGDITINSIPNEETCVSVKLPFYNPTI